jgi:hypothetical protein
VVCTTRRDYSNHARASALRKLPFINRKFLLLLHVHSSTALSSAITTIISDTFTFLPNQRCYAYRSPCILKWRKGRKALILSCTPRLKVPSMTDMRSRENSLKPHALIRSMDHSSEKRNGTVHPIVCHASVRADNSLLVSDMCLWNHRGRC